MGRGPCRVQVTRTGSVSSDRRTRLPRRARRSGGRAIHTGSDAHCVTFELEGKPQLAQDQPYAARLTASGPIAAIANLYGRGAVSPQMYAYDTLANSATPAQTWPTLR